MRKLLQANLAGATTTRRGRVLRVPGDRPGLLMVEGQQVRFSLDDRWRALAAPRPGLIVDVELDRTFQLVSVTEAADSNSGAVDPKRPDPEIARPWNCAFLERLRQAFARLRA